jgi:hypothetical protein
VKSNKKRNGTIIIFISLSLWLTGLAAGTNQKNSDNSTSVQTDSYTANLLCLFLFNDPNNIGHDSSGNGRDGTLCGAVTSGTGFNPIASRIGDSNGYISITSESCFNTGPAGAFTYSVAFQGANYNDKQVLLSRSNPCSNSGHFVISVEDNRCYLEFYSDIDARSEAIYSDQILNDGQPYRIFWLRTWGQTGTRLFVNGRERIVHGDVATRGTAYSNLPVFIGAENGNDGHSCESTPYPTYYFNGIIEEIAVWNRILSIEDMNSFAPGNYCPQEFYTVINDYSSLTLDSTGRVCSLKYQDVEQLYPDYFSLIGKITLDNGSIYIPDNIQAVDSSDIYEIRYDDCNAVVTLQIRSAGKSFIFTLLNISNLPPDTKAIDLFNIRPLYCPQINKDWAVAANDSDLFIQAMPVNVETTAWNGDSGNGYISIGCKVTKWMGFEQHGGALMTAPKSQFLASIEELVYGCNLPNIRDDGDGTDKWFRNSDWAQRSYLFAEVTSSNYGQVLQYAQKGHLKELLLVNALKRGAYNQPHFFPDMNAFYTAMDSFINNGIKIGIHLFINRIESDNPLFSKDNIYKARIGKLKYAITADGMSNICLDSTGAEQQLGDFFAGAIETGYDGFFLVIDNELIKCSAFDTANDSLTIEADGRGARATLKQQHAIGTPVYLAPNYEGFYIDPARTDVLAQSVQSLSQVVNRLGVNFLYCDGSAFVGQPNMDFVTRWNYHHKYGVLPYLKAFTKPMPLQFADDTAGYSWYYCNRRSTWDSPLFNAKDFTREWKVGNCISKENPYAQFMNELGWWMLVGPATDSNAWDFEATTLDEVHYVMIKALAYNRGIGLQLSSNSQQHAGINELFELIGRYNLLIEQDRASGGTSIPAAIKEYYKNKDREAELRTTDNLSIVDKKVDRRYAVGSKYKYTINNPFDQQKPHIEIRPRFDYQTFSSKKNILISDFNNLGSYTILKSDDQLSYNIDNKKKTITVTNPTSLTQSCEIQIPIPAPGSYLDLTGKRGLALQLKGDKKNEEVVVEFEGNGSREYRFKVDFKSTRTIILGDPASYNETDYQCLGTSAFKKHVEHDYARTERVSLHIVVPPGTSSSLKFNALKALAEKGNNTLVKPVITINKKTVKFPVTLTLTEDANQLLEYDGETGDYKLYNARKQVTGSGNIPTTAIVTPGKNNIAIASASKSNTRRADVRLTLYGGSYTVGSGLPFVISTAGTNGSIRPFGIVSVNDANQIFTAAPSVGYTVDKWWLDGHAVRAGGASYTLSSITAAHTVDVTFKSLAP